MADGLDSVCRIVRVKSMGRGAHLSNLRLIPSI